MIKESYAPLSSVIDLLLDAICVVDVEGRFVFVSAACERIFGYTPKEMLGKPMIDMVLPEDIEKTLKAASEIMSGHPKSHFENRYVRKDGQIVHIMWSAQWSESEQLRIAVARDITERKQAESLQAALYAISEAAHAAKDLIALFQQVHQIIAKLLPAPNFFVALRDASTDQLNFPYYTDEHDQSSAPLKLASTLCAEVIRTEQPLLLTPETAPAFSEKLQAAVYTGSYCWLGAPLAAQDSTIGALVLKSYTGGVLYTEKDKELLHFVSTQVVTAVERKQLYARLQYMAQYDDLTGLPNRAFFYDRMKTALARARRNNGRMSVLYLDLDNFKQVNDSHGHAAGDLLLQEVAKRLKQCVREVDTVARMSGDEFVVLLEGTELPEHAVVVSEKIRDALSQPVNIAGSSMRIPPSIGIAHYPEDGDREAQLLKHADDAMYAAKTSGATGFRAKTW